MSRPLTPHQDNTWTASGVTAMFDSAQLKRAKRRHRWWSLFWVVVVAIPLCIALNVAWQQLQSARLQTLTQQYDELHESLDEKSLAPVPVVSSLVKEADRLRNESSESETTDGVESIQQAIARLNKAEATSQKIRQLRPLLNPLGETLSPTRNADEFSPWLKSSSVIARQRKALLQEHASIVALLDEGKVDAAEKQLAALLRDVGDLQRDNVLAMKTLTARQTWMRLLSQIPERLRNDSALPAIQRAGSDAESGWNTGDWANARLLYAGATEDLQEFLGAEASPEEKATLLQNDAEAIARLETDKADLRSQLKQAEATKSSLADQLAAMSKTKTQADSQVKELQQQVTQLTSQTETLQKDSDRLVVREAELKSAQTAAMDLQQQLSNLKSLHENATAKLKAAKRQLTAKDAELTVLKNSGGSTGASGPAARIAAAIASMEASRPAERAATVSEGRERLVQVLEQYDDAIKLQQQAKARHYGPRHPDMLAATRAIDVSLAALGRELNALDQPLSDEHERLATNVETLQSTYDREVGPDKIYGSQATEAIQLRNRISGLKQQQAVFLAAYQRVTGSAEPSGGELVEICRAEVQELLNERRRAEFAQLKASGKIPAGGDIEFVAIPAGTFQMGSTDREDDEQPVHEVTITQPFYAGRFEVTVGQILKWLNSGVSVDNEWIEFDSEYCPIRKSGSRYALNTGSEFGKSEQQPMVEISWHGAVAYCEWLSNQDARYTYRLPTEAEWEYMARSGTTTAYPSGDSCNGTQANVNGNSPHGTSTKGQYVGVTTDVGKYAPSAFGLHDTVGNVYEWCSDWYDGHYYASSPSKDPHGPSGGSSRVCRGGSWSYRAFYARSAYRSGSTPDNTRSDVGFRVVAE